MEDLKIDRDKLFALEILNELEDSYINKINEGTNRDNIEPLRKCINYLRDEYQLDDKAEYLYSQYVKGLRFSVIYADVIEQMNKQEQNDTDDQTNRDVISSS
jgi:hypothetical protein